MPPTQLTELHALYAHILSQLNARCLARVCCVSRELRVAASCDSVWREVFARSHGEHSAVWAGTLEPVRATPPARCPACLAEHDPRAWRTRCEVRARAAAGRRAGLCHHRTMRFELGDSPETSPFFVSAYALNGCWLALGEASGALSLWDLRSGRRQWRKVAQGSDGTRRRWSIDEIHLDVLAGVIASSDLESGIVTVHKVADGELVSVVMHYPYVRILDPSDDYVAAAAANIAATAERAERHQAGEGFAEESHTELSDAGKATTPNLEGRLVRARLCSGERVGDASLPLCLLSLLCDMSNDDDAPLSAEPLGLLWHLPVSVPATLVAGVPQQWASHYFTGLMSEQAAVLATVKAAEDNGSNNNGSALGSWRVALLDVHSLLPLGDGLLPLALRRRVTMISLQRRSDSEWWLLVESEDQRDVERHGGHACWPHTGTKFQLDVVRLLVSHTAAALRAGRAEGAEATVKVLPYRSISLGYTEDVCGYTGASDPRGLHRSLWKRQPDWFSFDQHRWDVIGCITVRSRDEVDVGRLGAARRSRMEVSLLDLGEPELGLQSGRWFGPVVLPDRQEGRLEPALISPFLDLRGLWGDNDERQQPSAIIQAIPGGHCQTVSLVVWDGSARTQELRGTPASAVLRGLLTSLEPTRLEFKPYPDVSALDPLQEPFGSVANWRFVVVVDAVGVHVLDFLPRQRKAAADGGAG